MNIGAVNSDLSGAAAAQAMFAAAAQTANDIGSPASGAAQGSAGNVAQQAGVAVLRMALDNERSMVNILA